MGAGAEQRAGGAPERAQVAAAADLAAAIERAAGDLSLAEEPSAFVLALEAHAPCEPR